MKYASSETPHSTHFSTLLRNSRTSSGAGGFPERCHVYRFAKTPPNQGLSRYHRLACHRHGLAGDFSRRLPGVSHGKQAALAGRAGGNYDAGGFRGGSGSGTVEPPAVASLRPFIVLAFMLANSRWVVLDFMGLRGGYRGLSASLLAWPTFFALAAAAKVLMLAA
ncbi:hypothetical protein P6U16_22020 (plasmid) [Rhizobium sp. 32-5/1]|uniref:hypothetical protein n=1 Tax=Rhizobium sp. 32-5/1 TaxID=3019602 RepID=UPI00240D5C28|nr:hypothetical protein [Rhizobium sp. 32-5/1]WEZ85734.1 hypothetical protein P6U16_22020 [Rhizobium sp. 32-5/1]